MDLQIERRNRPVRPMKVGKNISGKTSSRASPSKGLKALLPTISLHKFLQSYFLRKHFHYHGSLRRLPQIARLKSLQSKENFFSALKDSGTSELEGRGWFHNSKGAFSQIRIVPIEAEALYHSNGFLIALDGIEGVAKPVADLMKGIAEDLRTPMKGASCSAFAAPRRQKSPLRFEEREVFFLQLVGESRWKVAPNLHITHPPSPHVSGPINSELRPLVKKLPNSLPKKNKLIILKPGSVLYLPRGYWHEYESLHDSLYLALTFPSITWLDYILNKLREQLHFDPKWREPALGASADGALKASAERAENQLYVDLVSQITKVLAGTPGE